RIAREVEFANPALKHWSRQLEGQRIVRVAPHGKAMLIRFANGLTMYSHNQLFGRWYTARPGETPETKRTLRLRIATDKGAALLYSASTIAVLDEQDVREHPYLSRLGPDLLDDESTPATFERRLREPAFAKRTLGALFLDQGFIAGVGNYLRSEICWAAKLDHRRTPASLTPAQRRTLAKQIAVIGRRAYETDGYTNDPKLVAKLKAKGQKTGLWFAAFSREGKPCYRCGELILREVANGRRIYRCPVCQPRAESNVHRRAGRSAARRATTRRKA
ncbi:MAG TPA: endonuclease VIII, partial [Xanthomonadales bacterium]|nr:endonuclease VIII [Xanthomonadales bacterium]